MLEKFTAVMTEDGASMNHTWHVLADRYRELYSDTQVKEVQQTLFQNLAAHIIKHKTMDPLGGTGRHRTVPDNVIKECLAKFVAGSNHDMVTRGIESNEHMETRARADWWGFTSFEHALTEVQFLRDVIEHHNIIPGTLWNNMQDMHWELYGAKLTKITIRVRPQLKKEIKDERLEAAKLWHTWPLDKLMCIIWVDEKTEYTKCFNYHCYAAFGAQSFQREQSSTLGKFARVHYIGAVNAYIGSPYCAPVTGTTGLKTGFMVRTSVPFA
jgi:hypothetical protein